MKSSLASYGLPLGRIFIEYVVLGLIPLWMVGSFALFGDAGPLWAERMRDGSLVTFAIVVLVVEIRDRLIPLTDMVDRVGVWAASFLVAAFLVFYAQLTTIDAQMAIAKRDQVYYNGIHVTDALRLRSGVVAAGLAVCFALVMAMRSVFRTRRDAADALTAPA